MELPFTVVFEPPSRSELRALLRMRGHWVAGSIVALTIGTIYLLANVAHADAVATNALVPLALTSRPAGAHVWLDGHEGGITPTELAVRAGPHSLKFQARNALDMEYALDVTAVKHSFDAILWRTQASVTRLRATLPGATLADARLLGDGSIGLSIGLPPGPEVQGWRFDSRTGGVANVLSHVAGKRLTFSSDGRYLAYLGAEIGPPRSQLVELDAHHLHATVVWLAAVDGSEPSMSAWRAPLESGEELVDLGWSPSADQLIVFSRQGLTGGATRIRVWLVAAHGDDAQPLLSLPSDVVPGSAAWSPDGRAVTFVAHANDLNALCLLRLDGTFGYVADLDSSPTGPVAFSPVGWSPDSQQLALVAPQQHPPGSALGLLQTEAEHAVFIANIDGLPPRMLAETSSDLVTWREDGQLLLVGRAGSDGPLTIRLMDRAGNASRQRLTDVPVKTPGSYAVTWDLARATALVAAQTSNGALDFWLVRLGLENDL